MIVASEVLNVTGGKQRSAEVMAWQRAEENRSNKDMFSYWSAVAVAIAFGNEQPPVPRVMEVATGF